MKYEDFSKELTVKANLDKPRADGLLWFANTGCQYPLVCPIGTKVKFKSIYTNFYGTWIEVEYKGEIRYCFNSYLDGNVIVKAHVKYNRIFGDPLSLEPHVFLFDREQKEYHINEKTKELEFVHQFHFDSLFAYNRFLNNLDKDYNF